MMRCCLIRWLSSSRTLPTSVPSPFL
jgi:hypothetical protein